MSAVEWLRGIGGEAGTAAPADDGDRGTAAAHPPPAEEPAATHAGGLATIEGERGIPSVSRERSVRNRIGNVLVGVTIALLGGAFLSWYYATQFGKVREAREAARRAVESRAGGEMRLGPLGRVDPPRQATMAGGATPVSPDGGPAPPAPPPQPVPPGAAGPAPKTPAELALERKLGQPVLLRGRPAAEAPPAGASPPLPGLAALLGGMQPTGTAAAAEPGPAGLGAMLRPTPTPAVAAGVLPTRRLLLPKGAFIDCTLETAIDSTYAGMATCIGASDVYGADGKVVLLERGTKYVGEQRGEPRQGQARVFVLWTEARTPAGVVVRLDSPATDELGRAGLAGRVDTHFWDRFGAAILVSVIDGGLQALAQSRGGGTIRFGTTGARDVMTEVLRGTLSIPPTVVKEQGERVQILVARDLDFRTVYALSATD